jgi:hypothetical protein
MMKPSMLRRQVQFRARRHSGLARVLFEYNPHQALAHDGKDLWELRRPHGAAPWKGAKTRVADYYCTPAFVKTQGERYLGCVAGNPNQLAPFQALIDGGFVPPLVLSPPPNESLWALGERLTAFGIPYWSGRLPYDSREALALLLVQKGPAEAKRYVHTDAHCMVVLRKERAVYERACAILEAEVGPINDNA